MIFTIRRALFIVLIINLPTSSMEFVHRLIHLDHTVNHREESLILHCSSVNSSSIEPDQEQSVTLPTTKRRAFLYFVPNKKMVLPSAPFKLIDWSKHSQMSKQLHEQWPITTALCSLIKHRWNIHSIPFEVRNLDDVLGSNLPVTFRTTFREPGTSIDINYQPLSRNVEVMAILSVKNHKQFISSTLERSSDKQSTLDVVRYDEDGLPETVRIISNNSLPSFALLVQNSQIAT